MFTSTGIVIVPLPWRADVSLVGRTVTVLSLLLIVLLSCPVTDVAADESKFVDATTVLPACPVPGTDECKVVGAVVVDPASELFTGVGGSSVECKAVVLSLLNVELEVEFKPGENVVSSAVEAGVSGGKFSVLKAVAWEGLAVVIVAVTFQNAQVQTMMEKSADVVLEYIVTTVSWDS